MFECIYMFALVSYIVVPIAITNETISQQTYYCLKKKFQIQQTHPQQFWASNNLSQ